MSTIVEATIPATEFALADTLKAVPEAEIEAVSLATDRTDRVVPLLWILGADTAAVTEALEADETTADVSLVSRRNGDSLFRMRWTDRVRFVTHTLVEESGALLGARATTRSWEFRVLFPEREAVSRTYDACRAEGLDLDLRRVSTLDADSALGEPSLSDEQFTTVRRALEEGYYEVPRGTTLETLAEDLEVSHQALSERLRRGHRAIVGRALGL